MEDVSMNPRLFCAYNISGIDFALAIFTDMFYIYHKVLISLIIPIVENPMGILIKNVCIVTNNDQQDILHNHAIWIDQTHIKEIGPEQDLITKYPPHQVIDGEGRLLLPGWINAHMHCYGTYARGLALEKAPQNFVEILSDLWWRLDKALDGESNYYSALIPAITAVKCGVTAIIDHHASPNAIDGSLDRIEHALEEVGLRAVLCYEVSDRDGPDKALKGLDENERYLIKCDSTFERKNHFLYDGMVGLHASFTLSDDTLSQAAEIAHRRQRGCHFHLAEGQADNDPQYQGGRALERLQRSGILGPKSLAAHAIHLTEEEIEILAQSQTMVVHNPQSNMNNAVGRTDIFTMLKKQIILGLGSDGMSASLYPEMRAAHLIHKHDLKNPTIGWQEIQKLALRNNARIYKRLTGQKVGRIESGYLADLILVDYYPPTPLTRDNFWGHVLFGIADATVDTTIIHGRIVMKNRQLTNVDEAEIAARSREFAARLWQTF